VNKLPADTPEAAGWHHAHGVDRLEKTPGGSDEEEARVSAEEQNKALVRRLFEAEGAGGDVDVLEELLAPDFVGHNPLPGQEPGRAAYVQFNAQNHPAYSDLRYIIEDQVASRDKGVSGLTACATHDRAEFMGIAPTGKEVTYKGSVIHRMSGGKMVEEWSQGRTSLEY
jgi:predicted ester cyclase